MVVLGMICSQIFTSQRTTGIKLHLLQMHLDQVSGPHNSELLAYMLLGVANIAAAGGWWYKIIISIIYVKRWCGKGVLNRFIIMCNHMYKWRLYIINFIWQLQVLLLHFRSNYIYSSSLRLVL